MKEKGDIVRFFRQKDYLVENPDLGGGSFGNTVLLKDPVLDMQLVAKKFSPSDEQLRSEGFARFKEEIKILFRLNHPNIVRIFSFYLFEEKKTGYILMEYVDGKDIDDYFEFGDPSQEDCEAVFLQMLEAFAYISKNQIVHRDIAGRNIRITPQGQIKVIDFGLGKIRDGKALQDKSKESIAKVINREEVLIRPEETKSGIYDEQTEVFYVGELYYRLLDNTKYTDSFKFASVLKKMVEPRRVNRYSSFQDVIRETNSIRYAKFDASRDDVSVFTELIPLLTRSIEDFSDHVAFRDHPIDVIGNLQRFVDSHAFDETISEADIRQLVSCFVEEAGGIEIRSRFAVPMDAVKRFLEWIATSDARKQKQIIDNVVAKLSTVRISQPLPF